MNRSDPLVLLSGIVYLNLSVLDNDANPPAVLFFSMYQPNYAFCIFVTCA